MQADMSSEGDVERLVQFCVQHCGRVDIFVNNAARFVFNPATEVTEKGQVHQTPHSVMLFVLP
jgi:NAD(P)-dependent dehydrogenase (short-subunit alcohol dehydrogenase family)